MKAFLPLQWDAARGVFEWPASAVLTLSALACGPAASSVTSGEAFINCVAEIRQRVGIADPGVSPKALQGILAFLELVSEEYAQYFFGSLLPGIAKLALKLAPLLKEHIEHCKNASNRDQLSMELRILAAQQPGFVLMRQELAASILACAFLCLYPTEERRKMSLPRINFEHLFISMAEKGGSIAHKLMCILNYFQRVSEGTPPGMISYERKVLRLGEEGSNYCPDAAYWSSSSVKLCQLLVLDDGTIENNETTALEVDFANKYLGGGALNSGCLQEEIRFMINPELIAGMLFLPAMADNEAIEIIGSERYSQYDGYGTSFQFAGNYVDKRPRDSWGRIRTHIVAIDALPRPGEDQFDPSLMLREVNKAFCGFLDHNNSKCQTDVGVATGNWGCGDFGGDHELKSVLQWLAASEAGRPFVVYYAFQDQRASKLQKVAEWICREEWCVLDLWSVLLEFGKQKRKLQVGFFDWLLPDN